MRMQLDWIISSLSAHTRETGYPVRNHVCALRTLYALIPHLYGDERGDKL